MLSRTCGVQPRVASTAQLQRNVAINAYKMRRREVLEAGAAVLLLPGVSTDFWLVLLYADMTAAAAIRSRKSSPAAAQSMNVASKNDRVASTMQLRVLQACCQQEHQQQQVAVYTTLRRCSMMLPCPCRNTRARCWWWSISRANDPCRCAAAASGTGLCCFWHWAVLVVGSSGVGWGLGWVTVDVRM